MRAGGCQCKGTSRHTLEFSREFDRQEPVEKCEVAFFLGITACHPSVTPATLRKGCKRPVHQRSVTLSPFKYFFPVCACAQYMTGCLFVMICCRKSWKQRATEKSGCADIHKTFHEFEHNYKTLKQFSYGTNGYNQFLPLSKNGAAALLKYKFDPYGLPYGLGWGSNIFTEVEKEQKTNKRTQDSHLSNWRQIKKGESVQNIGKKKEKDPNSLTTGQIIALVIGGLLIGAIVASPLGPWVMVFVLMYCLLAWSLK